MKGTALIFCAGNRDPWTPDGGPKHLVEIEGEILLDRTVRQLREREVTPYIVSDNPTIIKRYNTVFTPPASRWWVETCLSTQDLWLDEMMFGIMGDVFFSDRCMNEITDSKGLHYFGRQVCSVLTGGYIETWGMTWHGKKNKEEWLEALNVGLNHAEETDPEAKSGADTKDITGTPWQPYRWLADVPLDVLAFEQPHPNKDPIWIEVHDWTDDFDSQAQFEIWKSRYARRWLLQGVKPKEKEDGNL